MNILAVDDEVFNLEILSEWLLDAGATVDSAENGRHALEVLEAGERSYDAILLDRMMPEMDGLEFLAEMKRHTQWQDIPVIMQSAAATVDEVQCALRAGIWYYLSKPFERRKLCSIIETAVTDYSLHAQLRNLASETKDSAGSNRSIELQSLTQAQEAAIQLAGISAEPQKVVSGLYELLLNAIEHGNLEITYNEKTRLLNEQLWLEEIERRLHRAPYSDRFVTVAVSEDERGIHYRIKDQGNGFKSKYYLQLQTHRAADNHGRGIAFANQLSFSGVEFRGTGNEVCAFAAKDAA